MNDIVIKGGTIIDGSGGAGFIGDVGIDRSRIAEIGGTNISGKQVINADGLYITPGFIDITNHSDVTAAIFRSPLLENLALQGITTIIGGNCGTSLAPLVEPDVIHGIRKWADTSSINVNWLTMAEYLAEVERHKLSLNYGTLIGHGTLRRGITKDAVRSLTLEELSQLKVLLREALKEGALGFSTNLGSAHEHHATTEEIIEIVRVLSVEGGIYKAHLRDEGEDLISSLNEALRIGAETGVSVSISHLKAVGRRAWPLMKLAVGMIERDSQGGHAVSYDISPYLTTGSQLYQLLPPSIREGGFTSMLGRLSDMSLREKIKSEIAGLSLHFDRIRISEADDGLSSGNTIQELALRGGIDPIDMMIELLIVNRGRVSIIGKTLRPKNVEFGIKNKHGFIATNGTAYPVDGEGASRPHPRSFGTFPHFLHKYARDEKLLSWEEAIAKITSRPAESIGLTDRGTLAKDYFADIVVFDPKTLRDRATYVNPLVPPIGIHEVIVNGEIIVTRGAVTGKRPGKVIKKS